MMFITRIIDEDILELVLTLLHLDWPIKRDFKVRSQRIADQSRQVSLQPDYDRCISTIKIDTRSMVQIYRKTSMLLYTLNIIKYPLIMAAQKGVIPNYLNCYLLGRFSLHEELIPFLPVFTFQLSFLQVIYHILLRFRSCFDLDLILFLLQDERVLSEEINRAHRVSNLSGGDLKFPTNALQAALFYQIKDKNLSTFRLRPNRSLEMRSVLFRKMRNVFYIACLTGMVTLVCFFPLTLLASFFDRLYVKTYPSCCPVLEQLLREGKLGAWSVRFDLCNTRIYSSPLDLIENMLICIDHTFVFSILCLMIYLVTEDLCAYWQAIDREVRSFVQVLRFDLIMRESKQPTIRKSCFYHLDQPIVRDLFWLSSGIPGASKSLVPEAAHDEYIAQLQAMIEDFFVCLARIDRYAGLMIRLCLAYFVLSQLSILYLSLSVRDFWRLDVSKLVEVTICTAYPIMIILFTKIKRVTDKTYTHLCTLMALDRSKRKKYWSRILENYTDLRRINFTVASHVPLIWPYALNLMATTISALVVVETLKPSWKK